MFGNKKDDADSGSDVDAEVARLAGLPLRELAAEVMRRGFGATTSPEWTGRPGTAAVDSLLTTMIPTAAALTPSRKQAAYDLIGEGVQQLEHASLVRLTYLDNIGGRLYTLTRAGQAALADNTVEQAL